MTRFLLTQSYRATFTFGDDDPPPVPPVSPPPPPPVKMFTQEEVNRIQSETKRNLQKQNQELVAQLEELRTNVNLTTQQKEELDARIQNLSQQHLTDQQKLQLQLDNANKKLKADTDALTAQATQWRGAFEGVMVENAVLAGSAKHTAANADQMLDLLRSKAKVVQELDSTGQPTGRFVVKLPVKVTDPKTKASQVMELDAVEAIGKMREDPANGNLFLFDGKTGLGGTNVPNNPATDGQPDFAKMSPAQYQEWRKKNVKK